MRISDLQIKDIVSISDGKRLGKIIDVEIDMTGKIIYFVVEQRRGFRFLGNHDDIININMNQIKKIGEDVILVEI